MKYINLFLFICLAFPVKAEKIKRINYDETIKPKYSYIMANLVPWPNSKSKIKITNQTEAKNFVFKFLEQSNLIDSKPRLNVSFENKDYYFLSYQAEKDKSFLYGYAVRKREAVMWGWNVHILPDK